MHVFTLLFIGIVANIDNLLIGFSYGLKKTKIPFISNFVIASMSMLCSLIALLMGQWIARYINPDLANDFGGMLLIIIGGITITSSFYQKKQWTSTNTPKIIQVIYQPKSADLDENNYISQKESILLGLALAVNSISTSFSVGLTNPSFITYVLAIGLFSIVFIKIGVSTGLKLERLIPGLEYLAPVISGALLILIGLYEIIY